MRGHVYGMMALIHKSYKMSMKAWAKLTGGSSWRATAFESIRASQTSEEVVVAGVPVVIMVAEVAAMLVESQVEVAERREKSNDLVRYSCDWVSSY